MSFTLRQPKNLSVIIPVHNEEENIPLLHEAISRVLEERALSYEVIYVDDGSTDNTLFDCAAILDRRPPFPRAWTIAPAKF